MSMHGEQNASLMYWRQVASDRVSWRMPRTAGISRLTTSLDRLRAERGGAGSLSDIPRSSSCRSEHQRQHLLAARPTEQAGGDGEGPAGVGVVIHEQDGTWGGRQGGSQFLGDGERAGQ